MKRREISTAGGILIAAATTFTLTVSAHAQSDDVIRVCAQKSSGQMRYVGPNASCLPAETPLDLPASPPRALRIVDSSNPPRTVGDMIDPGLVLMQPFGDTGPFRWWKFVISADEFTQTPLHQRFYADGTCSGQTYIRLSERALTMFAALDSAEVEYGDVDQAVQVDELWLHSGGQCGQVYGSSLAAPIQTRPLTDFTRDPTTGVTLTPPFRLSRPN